MKKIFAILLILAMVFALAACGESGEEGTTTDEQPVTLTIGNVAVGDEQPYNHVLQYVQEYLEEQESTITLDCQTAGVLGGETELVQATIAGAIEMFQVADMSMNSNIPKTAFATFPGVFKDYDDVKTHYMTEGGWAYDEMTALMAENGLTNLGVADNGFRWITNSKHEIVDVEDLEGILLRVPVIDVLLDFWAGMDVQTTPIAWGELATALQQGVVDGQEVCPMTFAAYNFDEFNHYGTLTNYVYSGVVVGINTDVFESLSEKQQEDLKAAFAYGNNRMTEEAIANVENDLAKMTERSGFVVSEPSQELLDKIATVGYDLAHSDKWVGILGEDLVAKMYPEE